jgi:hypothetical protein
VCWFSPITTANARSGATSEITVSLQPGVRVAGRVSDEVPRPIKDAQIAVYTSGPEAFGFSQLSWMDAVPLGEDGTFEFPSLPAGSLRFHVVSEEWVSEVQTDEFKRTRPWSAGTITQDRSGLVIPMERTGACEITVLDAQGTAVAGASAYVSSRAFFGGLGNLMPGQNRRLSLDEVLTQKIPNPGDLKAVVDHQAAMEEAMRQFHILAGALRPPSRIATDAQGHAMLRGIPPGADGSSISVFLRGSPLRTKRIPLDPIKPGETAQITIRMDP